MDPKLLILDEPTRGIDVGAKAEIQALIRELADQGLGVLMISSELEEIVEGADRVFVLSDGLTVADLAHRRGERTARSCTRWRTRIAGPTGLSMSEARALAAAPTAARARGCSGATPRSTALVVLLVFNFAVTPHFATWQTLNVNLTQVATIVIVVGRA